MEDLLNWPRNPEPVDDREPLVRYLTSRKNHFSLEKGGYVKKGAFLPDKTGNVSVFRTRGLTPKGVWALGDRHMTRGCPLATGTITKTDVVPGKLDVLPDDRPKRHANITGWPSLKAEQLLIAQCLADRAKFEPRP